MGKTEGAMEIARAARKQFPILGSRGQATVDWQLVADHGKQAYENHRQTVARLAERGGLSWCELHAVLHDRAWQKMEPAEAMLGCREAEAKYLATVLEAELEAELAAMKARGDHGWLIEHPAVPMWLTLTNPCRDWTADSNEAVRFSRQCDAEAYIRDIGIAGARATEHRWRDQ